MYHDVVGCKISSCDCKMKGSDLTSQMDSRDDWS